MANKKNALEETSDMLRYAQAKGIDPKKIYTLPEVAKLLDVDKRSIYRYIRTGKLKAVKPAPGKYLETTGLWLMEFFVDQS